MIGIQVICDTKQQLTEDEKRLTTRGVLISTLTLIMAAGFSCTADKWSVVSAESAL